MKIKKKDISICSTCEGDGYTLDYVVDDFSELREAPRWCSECNGHGYKLSFEKQEKLKAMALSIFEEEHEIE